MMAILMMMMMIIIIIMIMKKMMMMMMMKMKITTMSWMVHTHPEVDCRIVGHLVKSQLPGNLPN